MCCLAYPQGSAEATVFGTFGSTTTDLGFKHFPRMGAAEGCTTTVAVRVVEEVTWDDLCTS
eukprot:3356383-Amphidinium_carterae.1